MNARQQEPPSSHLHGAGHNTSISRQRRTAKKQGGVFVAVFISGNIRRSDREQIREPEQMQVSDSDTQEIRAGRMRGARGRGQAVEHTEAMRASTEGQESRDSRGDGGGSRRHERVARTRRRSRTDRCGRE